jgi:hypothetical protein
MDILADVGRLVPLDVSWVIVFEPVRLRDALHKVARVAPKLVRSEDYKDIQARILSLYGFDFAMVEGPCLFAEMSDGKKFLVCAGAGEVTVPENAEQWKVGSFQGPVITRRDHRISLGNVDGHLVAGDESAVFKAVDSYVNGKPSFGALAARKAGVISDLSGEDAWRDVAMFFVGGSRPEWCPESTCAGTAIFGGSDQFVFVSIAGGPDGLKSVQAGMEQAWRTNVQAPWDKAKADRRIPEDYFKAAEGSMADHAFKTRENRVIMDVKGDIFDLLSVIRITDIDWFLGE